MTDNTPLRHPDTIAPGDWLLVYTQVTAIDLSNRCACIDTATGSLWYDYKNFFAVPSDLENGIKNAEKSPKYNPCRKFRNGDRVREVLVKGRRFDDHYPVSFLLDISVVVKAEDDFHDVRIKHPSGVQHTYDAVYLELVTSVEESEPYSVGESSDYFCVEQEGEEISTYWKNSHPNPKGGAEAECARLLAEWRKEMEK